VSSARDTVKRRIAIAALVGISLAAAARASGLHLGRLLEPGGAASAWGVVSAFASPDLSADFLARIARLSLESLFIGVLGTALAALVGVTLALVAARVPDLPDPPGGGAIVRVAGGGVRFCVRFVLGVLRAIPDIVWAFLFVRLLGLGPGPAVLAIAVSSGGSIGKLFAELAEAVDPGPVHALRRTGAGRLGVLLYGVLPQVQRQFVAYALFRLECSIRSASILGVVGAGGLGTEIALSVRYFEYDRLATALIAVLVFVIGLEAVSARLRRMRIRWTLVTAALGSVAALAYLDIPWSDLWRASAVAAQMAIGTAADAIDVARDALPRALETVAMAWCATIAAAAIAFLLAPLASRPLTVGSYLPDPPRPRGLARGARWLGLAAARGGFQICRAMPELTLALLFVVWVGPGATAGALAIALHTVGVFGRLYGDIYEEVEPGPAAALEATGASRLGVWAYGVLPQVLPRILAFTLYRFEVNVRMTAIVGFVGAGGIGDAIHTAISLFHVADLVVLLAVILGLVTALDWIGDRARHRILTGRFGARSVRRWRKPTRLANYRVDPLESGGDDDAHDETRAGRHPAPDRRDAVVRLLGAGED
jgi:phosphonate transport system permease protein